jgi:serine/threonine protein kinase
MGEGPEEYRFGELAVEAGLVTEADLGECLAAQKDLAAVRVRRRIGEILQNRGLLTAGDVVRILKEQARRRRRTVHGEIEKARQEEDASEPGAVVQREFGNYDVQEKVGAGAAGIVYRARHRKLDKIVALKILSLRLSRNRKFIDRFIAEARAAGRLSHQNIVRGIDVGEVKGRFFFSMEFVDGPALDVLLDEGPLEEERSLQIALDIARALEHAADQGIIHRDVKPGNILIDDEGRALLSDMGLALRADAATTEKEGAVLGTPDYMSPEQISGSAEVDTRSDIYSLGITLFQMLAGFPPFSGSRPAEVMAEHLHAPFPNLLDLEVDVSQGTLRLLGRMTAKDPEKRPQHPREVVSALTDLLSGPLRPAIRTPSRKPSARLQARRRAQTANMLYVLTGAALLFLAAVVIFSMLGGNGASDPPKPEDPRRPARPDPPKERPTLRSQVTAILKDYAEQPESFAEAQERLRALAGGLDPDPAREVWKEIEWIRKDTADRFGILLDGARRGMEERMAADDFAGAMKALDAFAEQNRALYGGIKAFGRVAEVAREIEAAAGKRLGELEAKATEEIRGERFDEALACAKAMERVGLADGAERAEAVRTRAREARAAWEARKRLRDEQGRLHRARKEAAPKIHAWEFAAALRLFETALGEVKDPGLRGEGEREIQDLRTLSVFLKALGASGDRASGKAMQVGDVRGTISGLGEDRLHLRAGKVTTSFRFRELSTVEMSRLVRLSLDFSERPRLLRGYAVYHVLFGSVLTARTLLARLSLTPEERRHFEKKIEER